MKSRSLTIWTMHFIHLFVNGKGTKIIHIFSYINFVNMLIVSGITASSASGHMSSE